MRSLLLWLLSTPALVFGLDWEKTQVSATVAATDSFYLAIFPFKNTSDKSVTIQSVSPSCGCTTPSMTKQTYAAGESGEVTAIFNFEGHNGLQEKSLTVITNEAEKNITELRFAVTIPPLLKFSPEGLNWECNEKPQSKKIKVDALEGLSPLKLKVQAGPGFTAEIVPLGSNGKHFELRITPIDTSEVRTAAFSVQTEYPEGTEREFNILAAVR